MLRAELAHIRIPLVPIILAPTRMADVSARLAFWAIAALEPLIFIKRGERLGVCFFTTFSITAFHSRIEYYAMKLASIKKGPEFYSQALSKLLT